jgi:CRP-like cAMP-binding protein
MANPLIRRLQQFTELAAEDLHVLERATSAHVRQFAPRNDIICEGDEPRQINVMLSGWACRYKQLEDGREAIVAFLLPGDLCNPDIFGPHEMDYSVGTLTSLRVAEIPRPVFENLTLHHPLIAQALWSQALVDAAIQREWTFNLNKRTAFERLSHLLCELFIRLRGLGLTQGPSCELAPTQARLADATGLSAVHINRTLQELRAARLIVLKGKTLTIPDLDALMSAALFNSNYLHVHSADSTLAEIKAARFESTDRFSPGPRR